MPDLSTPIPAPAPAGLLPAPAGLLPAQRMDGDTFIFPVRVYYEDTDAGEIVYYANYLRFLERARTEMLRFLGYSHTRLIAECGVFFAVRRCEIDYLASARLEDLLEVRCRTVDIGAATLDWEQDIYCEGRQLVRARVRLACLHCATGRPTRIPAVVRQLVRFPE